MAGQRANALPYCAYRENRIMRRLRQLLQKAVSEWQRCRGFQFRTRRRKLSCQNANTRAGFCGRPAGTAPDCGGRWSLPVSHAELPVGRLESKCSAVLCLPRSLLLPAVRFMNGGAIEFTSRGSFFVRKRMLAQAMRPAGTAPDCGDGGACQFRTRCLQSLCQ